MRRLAAPSSTRRSTLTAAAAGMAVSGIAALTGTVLARRFSAPTCTAYDNDYPNEVLHLDDTDATHIGPAVALLHEKYLGSGHQTAPASETPEQNLVLRVLAAMAGDATPLRAAAPSLSVEENFEYDEIVRSLAEAVYVIASNLAASELDAMHAGCDPDECPGINPDDINAVGTRYLLEAAIVNEEEHASHAEQCRRCRRAGSRAPALLRARFCRDLADEMLVNQHHNHMHVHGLPLQAAYDVLQTFVETVAEVWGVSPAEQVARFNRNVATALTVVEGGAQVSEHHGDEHGDDAEAA